MEICSDSSKATVRRVKLNLRVHISSQNDYWEFCKSAPSRSPLSRGSDRKHPNGGYSIPSSIHRLPQVGGNQVVEAPEVVFDLTQGEEGVETPPSSDSLKSLPQSTSRRSPPFFQMRLANKQMLKHYVKHSYHSSSIKISQSPLILSGPKTHQDRVLASYPVSSVKNA